MSPKNKVLSSLLVSSSLGLLVLSSICSANYAMPPVTVELPCGIGSKRGAEIVMPANPKAKYSVKSIGIKEKGVGSPPNGIIIKVVGDNDEYSEMVGGSKKEVIISALCGGGGGRYNIISTTGSQQECYKGEQVNLKLEKPRHPSDSSYYQGVVEVTTIYEDKKDYEEALKKEIEALKKNMGKLDGEIQKDLQSLKPGLTGDLSSTYGEVKRNNPPVKKKQFAIDTVSLWSLNYNNDGLIDSALERAITVNLLNK